MKDLKIKLFQTNSMNDLSKKIKVNTDQCEGDTQKSYSPRIFKQIKPFSFT